MKYNHQEIFENGEEYIITLIAVPCFSKFLNDFVEIIKCHYMP